MSSIANETGKRPKSIRTTVSVPRGIYEELEQLASRKNVSVAWVVRDAVRDYLENQNPLFRDDLTLKASRDKLN